LPRTGNGLSLLPLLIIDPAVNNGLCHFVGFEQQNFEIAAAASLLGWWRDAGVDAAVGETAHDWLGRIVATKSTAQAAIEPTAAPLPQSLDALIGHLMRADLPDAGPALRRLRPVGDPASGLMILVDFPDVADIESGQILADPIFDKMLDALGRTRETVYIATLCPGRPMTGRLSPESVEVLAPLARQHIGFVAPKQLWLIGGAASRAILGIEDAAAKGKLHSVNHLGTIMDAIATAHPRMFDGSKSRKAAAWAEMQRLMIRDDA
jgi:uracil-DNA glycosylase